ncbi:MAG: hypothetical protein ABI675_00500 [Chitinophagaceae bacterium]
MRFIYQLMNEAVYFGLPDAFLYMEKHTTMKYVIKGAILALILLSFCVAIIAIA